MTPHQALKALWTLLMKETESAVAYQDLPAFIEAREAHDALLEYLDDHVQPHEETE